MWQFLVQLGNTFNSLIKPLFFKHLLSTPHSGEKLWEVQCDSPTFTVAWHPKRPLLAYACDDKEGKYDSNREVGTVKLFGLPNDSWDAKLRGRKEKTWLTRAAVHNHHHQVVYLATTLYCNTVLLMFLVLKLCFSIFILCCVWITNYVIYGFHQIQKFHFTWSNLYFIGILYLQYYNTLLFYITKYKWL